MRKAIKAQCRLAKRIHNAVSTTHITGVFHHSLGTVNTYRKVVNPYRILATTEHARTSRSRAGTSFSFLFYLTTIGAYLYLRKTGRTELNRVFVVNEHEVATRSALSDPRSFAVITKDFSSAHSVPTENTFRSYYT